MFLRRFDEVVFTQYGDNPRAVPAEELEAIARELIGRPSPVYADPAAAGRGPRLAAAGGSDLRDRLVLHRGPDASVVRRPDPGGWIASRQGNHEIAKKRKHENPEAIAARGLRTHFFSSSSFVFTLLLLRLFAFSFRLVRLDPRFAAIALFFAAWARRFARPLCGTTRCGYT